MQKVEIANQTVSGDALEDKRLRNDDLVDDLIGKIVDIVQQRGIKRDPKWGWFARRQLDAIRCIIETHGWKVSCKYQIVKTDEAEKRDERVRSQALLEIIDEASRSQLTTLILAFLIGKLNPILDDAWKQRR